MQIQEQSVELFVNWVLDAIFYLHRDYFWGNLSDCVLSSSCKVCLASLLYYLQYFLFGSCWRCSCGKALALWSSKALKRYQNGEGEKKKIHPRPIGRFSVLYLLNCQFIFFFHKSTNLDCVWTTLPNIFYLFYCLSCCLQFSTSFGPVQCYGNWTLGATLEHGYGTLWQHELLGLRSQRKWSSEA